MSIAIYEALTFESEMVGGRNTPWLLTVKTEDGLASYVAKFFVHRDIEQQNALSREIYTSVLARELGLSTPDFALITIDEVFKETLPDKLRKDLERKDTRFAFGSKFIPGDHTYTPALLNQELAIYDIESIFAFDVLALNMDRRNKKSNILLGSDRYYLIDHEHTFALPTNHFLSRQLLSRYRFKNHIFYEVLHRKTKYGHKPEFGAFRELFHRLNIDRLDKYAEELELKGHETGDYFVIKQYLRELKQDISYFMNVVEGVVQ